MRFHDLLGRVVRLERQRGGSAEQQAAARRVARFQAAIDAYQREKARIEAALPEGWRLVSDCLVKGGHVVASRFRATRQPPTVENGVAFDLETREVVYVAVLVGNVSSTRPPCAADAAWQAECHTGLPAELHRAIKALRRVDWLDYTLNGKRF